MTATGPVNGRLVPVTPAGEKLCAAIDEVAGFLADEATRNDAAGRYARASIDRINEAGVLAACAPVDDGGFGVESLYDLGVATSRLAEADASVAIAAYMHLALSWYYARTVRCAPPGQPAEPRQREWLRAIGRRQMVVCSSVAEPGTNAWQMTTTATRSGGDWIINGRKVLASISPSATHFYTRVRAETADGPMQGSVMIPLDAAGVEVRDDWDGLGLRGSGSGEVVFSGVVLPEDAVSPRGRWGQWDRRGMEGRAASSTPLLAVYLGIAETARTAALASLRAGLAGARDRTHSAGTKAMLAEVEVRMAAARGALRSALSDIDAHVTHAAPRSLPVEVGQALMAQCVAAGMAVERAAVEVVDLAMQICGGRSYAGGHPLGRLCRDVRAGWFMRPHAPAEEWLDFLAEWALREPDGTLGR
ncbi:MAG TPA: acyl-CoA dehydrogenase family protein [Micromonosporaceae bacterium]|nr:acyl-CoA dehydrogenase family protein [Micromonosporaceae bacterium]